MDLNALKEHRVSREQHRTVERSLSKFSTGEGVDEWIEAGVAVAKPEADREHGIRLDRGQRF